MNTIDHRPKLLKTPCCNAYYIAHFGGKSGKETQFLRCQSCKKPFDLNDLKIKK